MPRSLDSLVSLPIPLVVMAVLSGCGSDSSNTGVVESPVVTTVGDDTTAFCAAVAGLDRTDGSTDPDAVLPLIDEMRVTAPADIRDDVHLRLDLLVEGNYGEHTSSTVASGASEVPMARQKAAAANVAAFVDEHCDLGRG